jgi:asparagine synthase (glutamine-hydrolysing)
VCGIAGIARQEPRGVDLGTLGRMAAAIRHRGPDGYGFMTGPQVGFAHVRLSIVDLKGGAQPLASEEGRVVVTFNGECYNYRELAVELKARGHVCRTQSDTEVLVHGWEEWGTGLFDRLNGQFAFALFDRSTNEVILVRDRFGVRPLFHAMRDGDLYFASEAKALFASGEVDAAADPQGLDDVFTFWGALPPRTPFRGVEQLPPGHFAVWRDGRLSVRPWYRLDYPEARAEAPTAIRELDELMRTGVDFRLRADVPVGGYLSGGLDSSITCALAAKASPFTLRTFSVAFDDPRFDESAWQRQLAAELRSEHAVSQVSADTIASDFPDVIRHTETPLVRTAPGPMYRLARLTRERGIKVVLTGEGADELFLGYDIFKEVSVRLFHGRHPDSAARAALFSRIYKYLPGAERGGEFWRNFFTDAGGPDDPLFSHLPRFHLTARIKDFYGEAMRGPLGARSALGELRDALPADFGRWSPLNRAAWLEMTTLLSPYLLSSQGDRMGMAHGIEGRYPFLDHRLFEWTAALPTSSKLLGLKEKEILRRWARDIIPKSFSTRGKQPYRAPDAPSFFGDHAPAWVAEMLDPDRVRALGYFEPKAVEGLRRRATRGQATGFRENQAIVAVLSTHLWHERSIGGAMPEALPVEGADVVIDHEKGATMLANR